MSQGLAEVWDDEPTLSGLVLPCTLHLSLIAVISRLKLLLYFQYVTGLWFGMENKVPLGTCKFIFTSI